MTGMLFMGSTRMVELVLSGGHDLRFASQGGMTVDPHAT